MSLINTDLTLTKAIITDVIVVVVVVVNIFFVLLIVVPDHNFAKLSQAPASAKAELSLISILTGHPTTQPPNCRKSSFLPYCPLKLQW